MSTFREGLDDAKHAKLEYGEEEEGSGDPEEHALLVQVRTLNSERTKRGLRLWS